MPEIFGLEIYSEGKEFLYNDLLNVLRSDSRKIKIAKVNAEFLVRSFKNNKFFEVLEKFDIRLPDGRGVLWAGKYLSIPLSQKKIIHLVSSFLQMIITGASIVLSPKSIEHPIKESIPGVEAMFLMLEAAEKTGSGVFFFGATKEDLERAMEVIRKKFPKLKIMGSLNGYEWQKDKKIDPIEIINNTDAKLLIVALGSPLQEYWIEENFSKLKNVKVAVGEGGSLSFLAGTLKKAPNYINKIGLEWLWRLFSNPSLTPEAGSRLKRVWNAVPVFIFETVKWKIKNG